MRAEGAAAASLAAMAHNAAAAVQRLLRFGPNPQPSVISFFSGCCATAGQQISAQRGGSAGRASLRNSNVLDAAGLPLCTPAFTRLRDDGGGERASSRFRPAAARDGPHLQGGARCLCATIRAAGLTSRCNVQHHRSTGAPRARWARPELGRDPDDDARSTLRGRRGATSGSRVFARRRPWRFNHPFSYSSPTAHFPSPA